MNLLLTFIRKFKRIRLTNIISWFVPKINMRITYIQRDKYVQKELFKIEYKWQKIWEEKKVFEVSVSKFKI